MGKMRKGVLITFEGGEGCGKSTHIRLLAKNLSQRGYDVINTHEPGATEAGKVIRRLLLEAKQKLDPYSEILLFAVDRIEHVKNVIVPALRSGKIVICDRFVDSTIAYQMGGRGLPKKLVYLLNSGSSFGFVPDLTVMLDVPCKEGLLRVSRRPKKDNYEKEELAFHERVRNAYLDIAREHPGRIKVISSGGTIDSVQQKVRKAVERVLLVYEKR